jgi:hypothetical protein
MGAHAVRVVDSVGLRAHLLGVRGFLHAPPLPPHPGERSPFPLQQFVKLEPLLSKVKLGSCDSESVA